MKQIYIKNFKGFDEQFIELSDVNFFVGENSTGKTSILKLINIINNGMMWSQLQFNNDEVELGHFSEILNINSKEKHFIISVENSNAENKGPFGSRVLFKFIEKKSIPQVSVIKFVSGTKEYLIELSEKEFKFRSKSKVESTFSQWINDYEFKGKTNKINFPSFHMPFYIIASLVQDVGGVKKKKPSNSVFGENKLFDNYLWLAPIRAKPKRIYESYNVKFSPEGSHIPSMIRNLLGNASASKLERVTKILTQFGKDSNLFDEIVINNYGNDETSPFEIIIKYHNVEVKLPNVGYGVSQCLPLIVEILAAQNTTFSIQQPEVHLHPKAQAAFGSFLYNAIVKDKNKFIVETHSDFTINRFRYCLYENSEKKINSQVLFFQRNLSGNTITTIPIQHDGQYADSIPDDFRSFFIDEELKLLEI